MPKIQWERLPKEKWAHLRDRAKGTSDLAGRSLRPVRVESTGSRCASRGLVQRFRDFQTVRDREVSQYIPARGPDRIRNSAVMECLKAIKARRRVSYQLIAFRLRNGADGLGERRQHFFPTTR